MVINTDKANLRRTAQPRRSASPARRAAVTRSGYVNEVERKAAAALSRALKALGEAAKAVTPADLPALEAQAMQTLARRDWKPDYFTVRRRADLVPPYGGSAEPLVVLSTAMLGNTRLIDNLEISISVSGLAPTLPASRRTKQIWPPDQNYEHTSAALTHRRQYW